MVVSRVGVCVWAIVMGAAMCIAQAAGINVNWLITIIGTPITSNRIHCRRVKRVYSRSVSGVILGMIMTNNRLRPTTE